MTKCHKESLITLYKETNCEHILCSPSTCFMYTLTKSSSLCLFLVCGKEESQEFILNLILKNNLQEDLFKELI